MTLRKTVASADLHANVPFATGVKRESRPEMSTLAERSAIISFPREDEDAVTDTLQVALLINMAADLLQPCQHQCGPCEVSETLVIDAIRWLSLWGRRRRRGSLSTRAWNSPESWDE